jgi:tRNA1(Val) A37 N6-methylase TrmN6
MISQWKNCIGVMMFLKLIFIIYQNLSDEMDALGRFYTQDIVSKLLINNLSTKAPKKILDMGVGEASLSRAAYNKWSKADYYATEIESHKVKKIERDLSFIKVFNYDSLNPNASAKLKIKLGSMDVAICNPPYIKVTDKRKYTNLFNSINCEDFTRLRKISSEIVFFAHNVSLLTKDGELGIIVSDSLITGKEYKIFRETILNKFDVSKIIQLPDNIFNKTEARTHIIFISKAKSTELNCKLLSATLTGKLSSPVVVPKSELCERMDYKFYEGSEHVRKSKHTLQSIGASITRGKYSFSELRGKRISYFHTTNFKDHGINIKFIKRLSVKHKGIIATKGDIVMCRVGKRSVGRVARVRDGKAILSDCIFRIRVEEKYQKGVFQSLSSEAGKKWLKKYAHGVCSQVISKSDLEKYPI